MEDHIKGESVDLHFHGSLAATLLDAIKQHAADPTRVACINGDDESDSVTFATLYARCLAVAAFLRDRGIGDSEIIGYHGQNSHNWICAFVGATANKAALTGITELAGSIKSLVENVQPTVVFAEYKKLGTLYEQLEGQAHSIKLIVTFGAQSDQADAQSCLPVAHINIEEVFKFAVPDGFKPAEVDESTLAWLCPTSGTTGPPKLTSITHKQWNARLSLEHKRTMSPARIKAADPQRDCHLVYATQLAVVGAQTTLTGIVDGFTTVIIPRYEPEAILRCVERHRIKATLFYGGFVMLIASSALGDKYDLSSLIYINYGGCTTPTALVQAANKRTPNATLCQMYGASEMTGMPFQALPTDPPDSCGQIEANCEAKVVNINTGKTVKRGEPGELYIRGPTVATSYYKNAEASAKVFLSDGFYRTGDYVRFDLKGNLYHICRMGEIYTVDGERVFALVLEKLLTSHPAVVDAAVIGVPMKAPQQQLRGFVVIKQGESLAENELREWFNSRVSSDAQRLLHKIQLTDRIPRKPEGKAQRMVLAKSINF